MIDKLILNQYGNVYISTYTILVYNMYDYQQLVIGISLKGFKRKMSIHITILMEEVLYTTYDIPYYMNETNEVNKNE